MTELDFNVNNEVRVRLTPLGRKIHKEKHEALGAAFGKVAHEAIQKEFKYVAPEEDADGWSTWQLWQLMNTFGDHCWNGCEPPFETIIKIPF